MSIEEFFYSIECGDEDKAIGMIKSGIPIDMMNEAGRKPLEFATHFGRVEIVLALLRAGADANSFNRRSRMTALHSVARHDFALIVDILVKFGAVVDAVDSNLWTPLHVAIYYNSKHSARRLCIHGADLMVRSSNGLRAEELASVHSEVFAVLQSTLQVDAMSLILVVVRVMYRLRLEKDVFKISLWS